MPSARSTRGFTLVEVLVALMVVVIGLAALLIAVSSTARTSAYLRDKTVAQWIALNRIAEVRLNINKFASGNDTGELDFANRKWHYDTRYFDTDIKTLRRVVVRVYAGAASSKGNPIAETVAFVSSIMSPPGSASTSVNWIDGSEMSPAATPGAGDTQPTTGVGAPTTGQPAPGTSPQNGANPTPLPQQPPRGQLPNQ